jgi:predicted porin
VTGKVGGVNYNQFAIGANYTLSPRTDVYAAVVYQTVNGRDSTGAPAAANVNGVSTSTNQHQAVGRSGIRTRF